LGSGVAALADKGIKAAAFPTDLSDPAAVKAMLGKVRTELGPIGIIHWNAYAATAGDLLTASTDDLRKVLDVGVVGLVAAVQEALPDLTADKESAVLVTGGGFSNYDPGVDAMAAQYGSMGLAVTKAAQRKLTGLLSAKLAPKGIYVGEVIVGGLVKGTAFDTACNAPLDAADIADKFYAMYKARKEASAFIA
jgi:NAD(P)-dependent dehydrogenase (short-subunit alcohol dehydrogenase family)